MELKKRIDFRRVLIVAYFVCFAIYLIVGLQPAGATNYEIIAEISIPSIELTSDVTALKLEDHRLNTPGTIVGSFSKNDNNILLIGHASTVFKDLNKTVIGDKVIYDSDSYTIGKIDVIQKADISMNKILAAANKKTLTIMTCAGEDLGDGDATHRLIITATKD